MTVRSLATAPSNSRTWHCATTRLRFTDCVNSRDCNSNKKPASTGGFLFVQKSLLVAADPRAIPLGDDLSRAFLKRLRLRQQLQRLDHFGVGLRARPQPFLLAEFTYEDLALDVRPQPRINL